MFKEFLVSLYLSFLLCKCKLVTEEKCDYFWPDLAESYQIEDKSFPLLADECYSVKNDNFHRSLKFKCETSKIYNFTDARDCSGDRIRGTFNGPFSCDNDENCNGALIQRKSCNKSKTDSYSYKIALGCYIYSNENNISNVIYTYCNTSDNNNEYSSISYFRYNINTTLFSSCDDITYLTHLNYSKYVNEIGTIVESDCDENNTLGYKIKIGCNKANKLRIHSIFFVLLLIFITF